MIIGISGAHRSGKTTLAKDLSDMLGIPFHATSTTEIARKLGYEAVSDLPLPQRLDFQEKLLESMVQLLGELPSPVILDRTPLDMAAYMLGELRMNHPHPELGQRIFDYAARCVDVTNRQFYAVIICDPLPVYEVHPDKPQPCPAYQWHHQLLVEGAANQMPDATIIRPMTNIREERVECVAEALETLVDQIREEKDAVVAMNN